MSGRRRQGLSPSLFPFLAVLVCTLGTLILLLALVAQDATDSAQRKAEADAKAEAAALSTKRDEATHGNRLTSDQAVETIEEQAFRVEQLVSFRDQQTGDMEARRDELAYVEDQIDAAHKRLQRLSDEVEMATADQPRVPINVSAIKDLEDQIAAQQLAIDELRADAKNQTPRVVIVPHKGPNGTDRRPVYVECDADGVTIWPEGSKITTLQLESSDVGMNTLDAALRVVRNHALRHYGDAIPPYPLLVVRPDGLDSYAAARRAMVDWDDQYGYELVPSDVKLAFAKPDAGLKQKIDKAIRDAVIVQHGRAAIAQRSGRGFGTPARGRYPTLSAASMDRAGRQSGFADHRGPDRHFRPSASGTAAYGDSQNGAADRLDDHLRSAAEEMKQQQAIHDAASSGGENGMASQSPTAETASSVIGQHFSPLGQAESNVAAPGGRVAADAAAPNYQADQKSNDNVGEQQGGQGNQSIVQSPIGQDHGNAADQPTTNDRSESNPYVMPNQRGGNSNEGSAQGSKTGESPESKEQPPASAQSTSGKYAASLRTNNTNATASPPSSEMQAATATSSPSSSADTPSKSISTSMSKDVVRRQGNDWALPPELAGARGTAVVRKIRVLCYPDRFVLLAPSTGGPTEMFGLSDGDVNRATIELATAVRDRIKRWGPSLPGGRWEPLLDVEVMPQSESRFHQLRTLMQGSGVEVMGRAAQ